MLPYKSQVFLLNRLMMPVMIGKKRGDCIPPSDQLILSCSLRSHRHKAGMMFHWFWKCLNAPPDLYRVFTVFAHHNAHERRGSIRNENFAPCIQWISAFRGEKGIRMTARRSDLFAPAIDQKTLATSHQCSDSAGQRTSLPMFPLTNR